MKPSTLVSGAAPGGRRVGTLARVLRSPGIRGLLIVGVCGWLLIEWFDWMGGPEAIRERYGFVAALIAVPVQAVVAVSPVPGELIALANSAIYGFWLGSVFNWVGWMLAAFIEYALVQRVAADLGAGAQLERVPKWLRGLPASHPVFLIVTRFLPFGSHIVNATAGLHSVARWRFVWTSAVALVPGSVLIAAIANGLVSLS